MTKLTTTTERRNTDDDLGTVLVRVIRVHLAPLADPKWIDCPECHQSATHKHFNKFSCLRCGWKGA